MKGGRREAMKVKEGREERGKEEKRSWCSHPHKHLYLDNMKHCKNFAVGFQTLDEFVNCSTRL